MSEMGEGKKLEYRRGTVKDSAAVFQVFGEALMDLSERQGVMAITGADDPEVRKEIWARRKPLFEHLARTAYEFWVAEAEGKVVGYGRSILRDDVLELTEFFVSPRVQSGGVGRELLKRVFPKGVGSHRVIVATTDVRAQVRYSKAGVVPRFPEMYWSRAPQDVAVESDLEFVAVTNLPETLAEMAAIDRAVLGHTREVDHVFLLETRSGFLYRRGGKVVGYGYLAGACGPMAVLEEGDLPAVLAHAEREGFRRGWKEVGFDLPMVNRAAIDYMLTNKYEMDSFMALIMTDVPLGKFENYVLMTPAFFI